MMNNRLPLIILGIVYILSVLFLGYLAVLDLLNGRIPIISVSVFLVYYIHRKYWINKNERK